MTKSKAEMVGRLQELNENVGRAQKWLRKAEDKVRTHREHVVELQAVRRQHLLEMFPIGSTVWVSKGAYGVWECLVDSVTSHGRLILYATEGGHLFSVDVLEDNVWTEKPQ